MSVFFRVDCFVTVFEYIIHYIIPFEVILQPGFNSDIIHIILPEYLVDILDVVIRDDSNFR